jgi:hypothetical protein
VRRIVSLGLLWANVTAAMAGCGGRTLAVSDGDADAGPGVHEPGNDDRDGTAENTPQATDDAGRQDEGTPDLEMEFFVCPPSPPPADADCDPPGQVCAYYGFSSCQSWICSSHGWQAGGQGC